MKPRAATKSWVLPGVIRKASGGPISSVSAWILVVGLSRADWLGFERTRAGKDVQRLGRMMLIAACSIAGRAAPHLGSPVASAQHGPALFLKVAPACRRLFFL